LAVAEQLLGLAGDPVASFRDVAISRSLSTNVERWSYPFQRRRDSRTRVSVVDNTGDRRIGMPVSVLQVVFGVGLLSLAVLALVARVFWVRLRRNASASGFDSVRAYLRATPHTDREKREAVDLALVGLVLLALGLMIPPLLLVGIVPLFYGLRKIAFASMGLGWVDDPEEGTGA
jgi:hypothetical protein